MTAEGRKILLRVEIRMAQAFADSYADDQIMEAIGERRDPREAFSTPRILEAWRIIATLRDGNHPSPALRASELRRLNP